MIQVSITHESTKAKIKMRSAKSQERLCINLHLIDVLGTEVYEIHNFVYVKEDKPIHGITLKDLEYKSKSIPFIAECLLMAYLFKTALTDVPKSELIS